MGEDMAHGKSLELAKITLPEPTVVTQAEMTFTKNSNGEVNEKSTAITRRVRRNYLRMVGARPGFLHSAPKAKGVPQRPSVRSSSPAKRRQAAYLNRKEINAALGNAS